LFGAFAVLYSTFFVANAGHGRVFTDAMRVIGLIGSNPRTLKRSVRCLSAVFPCLCLLIYWQYPKPANLVLFSGLMQAMMLPMLAGATLFFRYRRCDARLKPGRLWDAALWLSAVGMLIAGGWAARTELPKIWGTLTGWFG